MLPHADAAPPPPPPPPHRELATDHAEGLVWDVSAPQLPGGARGDVKLTPGGMVG